MRRHDAIPLALAVALFVGAAVGAAGEVARYVDGNPAPPAPVACLPLISVEDPWGDIDDGEEGPRTCDECVRDSDCEALCGLEADHE